MAKAMYTVLHVYFSDGLNHLIKLGKGYDNDFN